MKNFLQEQQARYAMVALGLVLTAALLVPVAVRAQAVGTETTLYTFTNGTDGEGPTDLVPYTDGNFYGTVSNTVFKVTPGGTFTSLYTFCPACAGDKPDPTGLTVGPDGNFYGLTAATTSMGATFYTITSAGAYTALNSSVAGDPAAGAGDGSRMILGSDGNFYGANAGIGTSGSNSKSRPTGQSRRCIHSVPPAAPTRPTATVRIPKDS